MNTTPLGKARVVTLIIHFALMMIVGSVPSNNEGHVTTHLASSPETSDHYVSIRDMLVNIIMHRGDVSVPSNRFRDLVEEAYGLRDCPAIQDRKVLCPSFEYEDHDHNRRPSTITHSICQCTGCAIGHCIEHKQALKVSRRHNETTGFYPDWELVSQACYCTKAT